MIFAAKAARQVTDSYRVAISAAVLRKVGVPIAVETIRLRDIGPDELRVRIDATGVCHSDLSLARGRLAQPTPTVLGHEACGTVLETGPAVGTVQAGDRVVLLWISPCRECFFCRRGEPHLCEHGSERASAPYALDQHDEPIYPVSVWVPSPSRRWSVPTRWCRCRPISRPPTRRCWAVRSPPASAR